MQNLFKNKVLSIVLTIALIAGILGGVAVLFDGSSSGATSGSSNPGSNSNSGNSAGVVDFSELTYVAMGDSITYGFDSTNNGAQMAKPYPLLVKELLGLNSQKNYGISSSTLCNVDTTRNPFCLRYKNMTDNADIVSIMGGINDYWLGNAVLGSINTTDTKTIYGALNVLCKGLKAKYPNAYIFFMTPYKWANDPGQNAMGYSLSDICDAIKEVCKKYDIDVLDMYTYGQFEVEMYNESSDGLHPSQAFFEQYTAPQIAAFIKSNYK